MILRTTIAAVLIGGCLVSAAGCGRSTAPASRDHGRVVANLPISLSPLPVYLETETIDVNVAVGQRFSIKVNTSDGPVYWSQFGRSPNPRVIKVVGDFNDGHCAPNLVGCRVPYFHTLLARARGSTTMAWRYRDLGCAARARSQGKVVVPCERLRTVIFDIMVR